MEEDSHNAYTHVSCNQLRSQFQMMIYLKVATQKSTSILGVCHSIQYNFRGGNYFEINSSLYATLIIQLLGAMYFGFGMLNWMSKDSTVGGIYNKPLSIGNFSHFFIGAITLMKLSFVTVDTVLLSITIIYSLFAICFGLVSFHTKIANK